MKVIRIIRMEAEVEKCSDCPYFKPEKEGSECIRLEELGVKWPENIVSPAWQEKIDLNCPLK